MTVTVGSGLGGFTAVVAQPTYGATFIPPTRFISAKSNKVTHNPHIVQGGPYLRGGSTLVDLGSAHVQTWLDANGTLTGDMMNTGEALMLACAMGGAGSLAQIGTSAAWQLNAIPVGAPEQNARVFDMQIASPTDDGTLRQFNYLSCMVTKGEWVFDRSGLVSKTYDWDAQTVQESAALVAPTYPGGPVPFSFGNASSLFKLGTLGGESAVTGCRKVTVTVEHKLAVDRAYLGNASKSQPITNNLIDVTVACDFDYTTQARTVMETFLTNTAQSIIITAVGNVIGASGQFDTLTFALTNGFIQTGGEAPLDGQEVVKNTVTFKATIDAAGDSALKATLITADVAF